MPITTEPAIKTWGAEATGYGCTLVWQRPNDLRHTCRNHADDGAHRCGCGATLEITARAV